MNLILLGAKRMNVQGVREEYVKSLLEPNYASEFQLPQASGMNAMRGTYMRWYYKFQRMP